MLKTNLLLKAILGLFLIGILIVGAIKFGYIDFVGDGPLLTPFSPLPTIKVAVVGRASPELKAMLEAEDFRVSDIYYAGDFKQEIIYPGALNNFNVVILQNTPTCGSKARKIIADKVKSGGKFIVIGDACLLDEQTNQTTGWQTSELASIIPVVVEQNADYAPLRVPVSSRVSIANFSHPIFKQIKKFGFNQDALAVTPKTGADTLASSEATESQQATPLIVEKKTPEGSKIIYLAYDPSPMTSRNMFLNMLLYLGGRSP